MGPPYSKPCSSPPLHFLFAFRGLSKCSRGSDGSDIFPFLERKFTHFFFFSKNFNKTEKHQTIVAALDMPLPEDYIRRLAPPTAERSFPEVCCHGRAREIQGPGDGRALRDRGGVQDAEGARRCWFGGGGSGSAGGRAESCKRRCCR